MARHAMLAVTRWRASGPLRGGTRPPLGGRIGRLLLLVLPACPLLRELPVRLAAGWLWWRPLRAVAVRAEARRHWLLVQQHADSTKSAATPATGWILLLVLPACPLLWELPVRLAAGWLWWRPLRAVAVRAEARRHWLLVPIPLKLQACKLIA